MKKIIKEYQVDMQRTYHTTITLRFPDNGKNHKLAIEDNLKAVNELEQGDIWSLIAEKELEQMDITNESWEISEKESTESHWEFDENGDNIIK
tara:strand:- start:36 stop:314 length:279 start_codon:yes stop_codon:yes gene_type:complete